MLTNLFITIPVFFRLQIRVRATYEYGTRKFYCYNTIIHLRIIIIYAENWLLKYIITEKWSEV